jgi:hypothetical protein
MTLTCSSCKAEVPEGARECPHCGAGLGTVMFGKGRGLTRTLIGKAVELRDSIPWATASAVVMVRDEGGKPKPRPKGIAVVGGAVAVLAVGGYFLFRSPPKKAEPVVAVAPPPAPEPPSPMPEPKAPAIASAPAKAPAAKPSLPEPPPAKAMAPAGGKPGTLVVKAAYRGKPVAARVKVNGEAKGMTPLTVALAPSKYTLTLESSGFKREKRTDVQVVAGRKAMLAVDLKK